MAEATNYIKMKRCLQCFYISDNSFTKCLQCGYLFLSEASKEEAQAANDKIEELRKKKDKDIY